MKTRVLTLLALWLTIAVTGKAAKAPTDDYAYTYKGVKYTYITEHNYTRFFNTSIHKPEDYGWYTDKEGWFVNAEKAYITAASIDADNFPSSGEVYILNDLVGFFADHTHLGCIADNAFRYMSGVRRVYFQDCAAMSYTSNSDFYFFIGDCAFADCENLEEVNLMQWTTSGDNHWEAMPPTAVKRIWGSMLDNSPKAWIRVGNSVYQQYLGSQTWVQVRNRITTFEHASDDITVNGAVYGFLKAEDGTALSNADEQHEEIMKTLRLWNADYREFNAASLLSDKSRTTDNANLWYTTVTGADADYLKKNDGVLRIYNDPGSYYNYKTIAIRKEAFKDCDDLKAVEFWQANGRSDNSYSDMRMVIENGAFSYCKILKEIRMFYKVEDGTDRWQVLGPENVIPGKDIFGVNDRLQADVERLEAFAQQKGKTMEELTEEEIESVYAELPKYGVRIIVSPDRYIDFINDPNWAPYSGLIVAADYMPSAKDPIVKDGITYNYLASSSGINQSDQVVTQNLSWWNVPIILAEVAIALYSMGSSSALATTTEVTAKEVGKHATIQTSKNLATNTITDLAEEEIVKGMNALAGQTLVNVTKFTGPDNWIRIQNLKDLWKVIKITDTGSMVINENRFLNQLSGVFYEILTEYVDNVTLWQIEQRAILFKTLSAAASLTSVSTYGASNAIYSALSSDLNYMSRNYGSLITASFSGVKALGNAVNQFQFNRAMKDNIIANMHQVGMVGGQLITTPSKELVYHTYIADVADDVTDAKIYTNPDDDERTVAISKEAFRGKTNLKRIGFWENDDVTSHETTSMLIALPDSVFANCTSLETFDLRLHTDDDGIRALGPEHFLMCGDNLFAGCDTTRLQILVGEDRLQDFLSNDGWAPYANFFVTSKTEAKPQFTEFGVKYAYAYDSGNKKEEKLSGRTIEHLIAVGPDDDYINDNNGALGFFNDIGSWNNYKLDYASPGAFRKNANVESVSFWDLAGWLWTGTAYTDLQMVLRDSCFADCPNLEYVDMLYLRTDGSNIAEPLTPKMLQLGNGVFDNSPKVRFKMTERQTEWFAADTTWAKYQDRFLPCLFLPADPVVVSKLSDLKYRTDVARSWYDNNASKWGVDEYLEKENWVGEYMFHNCKALETLILPASVTEIGENAFEEATNLRRLCIGEKLERYTRDLIEDNVEGLDELVFLTDQFATSESDDPWEGNLRQVFTKKSTLGNYMSDIALTGRAQYIAALFEDDQVLEDLLKYRYYFPSQYLNMESTRNPRGSYSNGDGYFFYRDKQLKSFDEFKLFSKIRELDCDFENCTALERITLPNSLERIGYDAFRGCEKLATIHISADSVPVLDRDALRDLPADFQIIVPKTHVKRYREKWEQYADHIVNEDDDFRNDIIEVTLTEPNTLAEKLGLTVKTATRNINEMPYICITSLTGDYSNIRALKVNGPISCADFTVMRFLAGYDVAREWNNYTHWGACRNYLGTLEYIDLYDADIRHTQTLTDGNSWEGGIKYLSSREDDVLPGYAFGRCYTLKTVILPKSMKRVKECAFKESEYLETLVIGDDCEEFNWNSLDDCASMTRMYILSKKKMEMDQECWVKRALFNNYSPTFDAFYVRPSLYSEYVADEAYIGSSQRTNNISSGIFKDDESFAAFAAHAVATEDDLRQVNDISGWFRGHEMATDLNALQYTCIDSLRTADMAPLTQMRSVTLPSTIKGVGKDAFKNATGLRYVDMSQCADYVPTLVSEGGVCSLGIGENTLVYVPAEYGESSDVNVAVSYGSGFKAQTFRLVDGLDYCVPFAVEAQNVENTRTLTKSGTPYTVCLPYALDIPAGAKVYQLSGRGTNELIFAQHTDRMEAMQPYLVWAENADALLSTANVTLPSSNDGQTIGSQQQSVGYTLRGTLNSIDNAEAVELGAYVLNDDSKWHPVLSDTEAHKAVTIPAFRCYLLQSRYNGARAISMTLTDATGIEQLRTIDNDGTERVFDLSGRRIDGNAKGIVIKNGKKMFNK